MSAATGDRTRCDGALVSVVIPCHGHGHLLGEAIDSALAQTHPHVEIVVVDDGSPDDTAAVAESFAGVRLVRQQQAGLAAARNAGMRASTGDFIAFLDADDRLYPDAIAAGLDAFDRWPDVAFVAGGHRRVDGRGDPLPVTPAERLGDGDAYIAFLRGNWIGMHAAVLYRREAVEAAGGFDPTLPACEDYDLYLRIARVRPVRQHDAVVAEYRRHGANMSDDVALMMGQVLHVLQRQLPHVVDDRARFSALREGLWNFSSYYLDGMEAGAAPASGRRQRARQLGRSAPRRIARAARRSVRSVLSRRARRSVGRVDLGDLRRVEPFSREFGYDRGTPVDRVYIERFLGACSGDVRGRVLEIGDSTYTTRFGGDAVTSAEVLHVSDGLPSVTYVGTLEDGGTLPSGAFDCVILTQTLHLIFDVRAALATVERVLAPGGVLLATVPGISQLSDDQWSETWSWAITPYAMRELIRSSMPEASIDVSGHGNVLTTAAFLYGMSAEELARSELDHHDAAYPMLVTARAAKPSAAGAAEGP